MTYIIKHDFEHDIPFYVKVGDDAFDEIYDPKLATQFKTKKEAYQWINQCSSMREYSKPVTFEESVQNYEKWVKNGTVRRTLSYTNRTMSRKYKNEPLEEVIDWRIYAYHNGDKIDFEDYKTWPELFSITNHLIDVVGNHSENYEELYTTFRIYTGKYGNFDEFQSELNLILDKVTYKVDDGSLMLPIFDHHEDSVSLMIHPENKKVKIEGRWEHNEFSSLEEAFNYMKRERYY